MYLHVCVCVFIYIYIYMVPCRRVDSPTPPYAPSPAFTPPHTPLTPPGQGQAGASRPTIWVLLASSSLWLQVDPTWWLQDDQNHAPTIGVLAPLSSFLLPSWRVVQAPTWPCWRVLEACNGPSWGQQAFGESTVWVLLASFSCLLSS